MKKILSLSLSLLLFLGLFPGHSVALRENLYAPYRDYEELRGAYEEALARKDLEKVKTLEKIGRKSLEAEMEEQPSTLSSAILFGQETPRENLYEPHQLVEDFLARRVEEIFWLRLNP